MTKDVKAIEVTESSGNVFSDLALDNPDGLKLKSKIASSVNVIVRQRGLKQAEASKTLNISQPQISALSRRRLYRFSVGKLFYLLNALDRDVDIIIKSVLPVPRNLPEFTSWPLGTGTNNLFRCPL